MWPLLREASAAFGSPAPPTASPGDADDEEAQGVEDDSQDSDGAQDDGGEVFISGATGKLRVSTCMHHLYFRRCHREDTDHPYHDMCYVVWTRLVRVETPRKGCGKTSKTPDHDDTDNDTDEEDPDVDLDDEEPDGIDIEDCDDIGAPRAAAKKPGRKPSDRHEFVGLPKMIKQQVRWLSVVVLWFVIGRPRDLSVFVSKYWFPVRYQHTHKRLWLINISFLSWCVLRRPAMYRSWSTSNKTFPGKILGQSNMPSLCFVSSSRFSQSTTFVCRRTHVGLRLFSRRRNPTSGTLPPSR